MARLVAAPKAAPPRTPAAPLLLPAAWPKTMPAGMLTAPGADLTAVAPVIPARPLAGPLVSAKIARGADLTAAAPVVAARPPAGPAVSVKISMPPPDGTALLGLLAAAVASPKVLAPEGDRPAALPVASGRTRIDHKPMPPAGDD